VEALVPGVLPTVADLEFGDIGPGAVNPHLGAPLAVTIPLTVTCGDALPFRITFTSAETGQMEPEEFEVAVDGDPGSCNCDEYLLLKFHRGVIGSFSPGWQSASLPLTSDNDDETSPFPVAATLPGTYEDTTVPPAPFTIYRLLLPENEAVPQSRLTLVKTADGLRISVE
jgi:hypothetical protein